MEELPLVRRRRSLSSAPIDTAEHIEEVDDTLPSSPPPDDNVLLPQQTRSDFPSDEVPSFFLKFINLAFCLWYLQ